MFNESNKRRPIKWIPFMLAACLLWRHVLVLKWWIKWFLFCSCICSHIVIAILISDTAHGTFSSYRAALLRIYDYICIFNWFHIDVNFAAIYIFLFFWPFLLYILLPFQNRNVLIVGVRNVLKYIISLKPMSVMSRVLVKNMCLRRTPWSLLLKR